jgi:hypothetical protein
LKQKKTNNFFAAQKFHQVFETSLFLQNTLNYDIK